MRASILTDDADVAGACRPHAVPGANSGSLVHLLRYGPWQGGLLFQLVPQVGGVDKPGVPGSGEYCKYGVQDSTVSMGFRTVPLVLGSEHEMNAMGCMSMSMLPSCGVPLPWAKATLPRCDV